MLIPLSERDIRQAAGNALERRLEWLREGRAERYESAGAAGLGADFVGCLGEYAVAKWLDRFPFGFSGRGGADVRGVEVRSIDKPGAALQVYPSDPDNAVFVLAFVGDVFREGVRIVGWLPAAECKRLTHWRTEYKRAAYMVPQTYLEPAASLAGFLSPEDKQCASI
jgi:hypothetical protein